MGDTMKAATVRINWREWRWKSGSSFEAPAKREGYAGETAGRGKDRMGQTSEKEKGKPHGTRGMGGVTVARGEGLWG